MLNSIHILHASFSLLPYFLSPQIIGSSPSSSSPIKLQHLCPLRWADDAFFLPGQQPELALLVLLTHLGKIQAYLEFAFVAHISISGYSPSLSPESSLSTSPALFSSPYFSLHRSLPLPHRWSRALGNVVAIVGVLLVLANGVFLPGALIIFASLVFIVFEHHRHWQILRKIN